MERLINARNVPKHSTSDEFAMEINGAVPMKKRPGANFMVPGQLMGGLDISMMTQTVSLD